MRELSILIPARNEMFLARTIQDILEHKRGDTEVIAVCDGAWAEPPIEQHPDVTLLYYPESSGQRAATNAAARLSTGRYLMKVDAHCAFDEGFDVKLMADMQPDWTMVPVMRNLPRASSSPMRAAASRCLPTRSWPTCRAAAAW